MKQILKFFLISALCFSFHISDSQVPMSVCTINLLPIDGLEIVSVGTVTGIIDSDTFILSSEGCDVQCDGELNEMPLPGFDIYILGVIEYENIGNDLEIDTDYWVLIDDGQPDDDPPPVVFTVEDAQTAPFGQVALLSGDVTAYIDEVSGFSSFTDVTGTMDMDFKSDDLPDLDQELHVLGVVEPGNAAPPYLDVFHWYYEGQEPPPGPEPIGWNIGQIDSLPVGSFCFLFGEMNDWVDEGEGDFDDGIDTINVVFVDSIDVLPELEDSIFILGFTIGDTSALTVLVHHWTQEFAVGINEVGKLDLEIRIFPNPANDILYIESEHKISRAIIYNIEGKVVMDVAQNEHSVLNVSNLAPGIYVLSLFNENEYLTAKRLVIE